MTGETGFKKNSRFEEDQRTVLLFPPVLKITDERSGSPDSGLVDF